MRNIILFISDQQRADCMPGSLPECVQVPNLSWLASRGVTFDRAYCTSPLCTPARASILTGTRPSTNGIVANYRPGTLEFPKTLPTVGDYLKKAGYETAYGGKWHLPTGSQRPGFDHVLGRLSCFDVDSGVDDDAINQAQKWGANLGDNYTSYLREEDGTGGSFHGRSTWLPLSAFPSTQMALRSSDWLRRPERKDAPFFLTFSCIEPHPLGTRYDVAPAPFDRMYQAGEFQVPETARERGVGELLKGRNFAGLKATDSFCNEELRAKIAQYMGAVSYVDFLLGLLLESVAANDLLDDTLIIFTSDHGEMLGHHRMLKKGPVLYEDLVRVPYLLADCSGKVAPRHETEIVSHLDILPTCLDEAGSPIPASLPGISLKPALDCALPPSREGFSVEYHSCTWGDSPTPLRAYIEKDWKLVVDTERAVAVYNLQQDPGERRNLLQQESETWRLKSRLDTLLSGSCDRWPEVGMPPDIQSAASGEWDSIRSSDHSAEISK